MPGQRNPSPAARARKCLRRGVLALILAAPWLSGCGGGDGGGMRVDGEPPCVLLITIDTLRADHTSLHGYERPTTPHLERLAATGVTFEQAFSPSSWTRASFASYFTGLHPSTHGCEDREGHLDGGLTTLAELFRARGFVTAGIYANYNIGDSWGFAQGFDLWEHPPKNAGYPDGFQVTDAAGVNERVIRWLRDERPADRPWFLFVLYMDPHDPYLPHAEHRFAEPAPGVDGSRRFLDREIKQLNNPRRDEMRQAIRDLYDGEVAYADRHLGELLDEIDRLGLADEAAIVVTADHGEGLWDHKNYRGHGRQVFQEQIHVPLVVRWPGRTEPGRRIAEPVAVLDVFGALAEAYDLQPPDRHQARSLLDAVSGGSPPDGPILVEERLVEADYRVLVEWPWKLIRDDRWRRHQVFNLVTNPDERPVLAERKPQLEQAMFARLQELTEAGARWREQLILVGPDPGDTLSEDAKRELKALGY